MTTETWLHFLSGISAPEKLKLVLVPTVQMQVQKYRQEQCTRGLPRWKDEYPFDNLYIFTVINIYDPHLLLLLHN